MESELLVLLNYRAKPLLWIMPGWRRPYLFLPFFLALHIDTRAWLRFMLVDPVGRGVQWPLT